VELARGTSDFSTVVSTRYAEWRNLFRVLKELKRDESSALRSVSIDATAPMDFDNWGRERSPMFADEFGKFLRHGGCVDAVREDLGCAGTPASGGGSTPAKAVSPVVAGRVASAVGGGGVDVVEKSFRRMKTPSKARESAGVEEESFVVDQSRRVGEPKSARGVLGGASRVQVSQTPAMNDVMSPAMNRSQVAMKSPPPTPRPAQLSPPPNEYADYSGKATHAPSPGERGAEESVEHLMSYLTGFHGLLFGLKDHVERIRGSTVENVAHELARTDARLDTAIARLEAAMSVESGRK
jgi:hypothetical protein